MPTAPHGEQALGKLSKGRTFTHRLGGTNFPASVKIHVHLWLDLPEQFRSLRNRHMLNITMRKSSVATKPPPGPTGSEKSARIKEEEDGAAAAELALKAHVLRSDPEILAEMAEGDRVMQEIVEAVDLTEAPEDAVCGLVIDLLQYCEREKIDWTQDVMSRAREHFRSERVSEIQER